MVLNPGYIHLFKFLMQIFSIFIFYKRKQKYFLYKRLFYFFYFVFIFMYF